MRGILNYFIVFILLGLGGVSCRQDFDSPIYVFNVDDEFSFSMKEKFHPDTRGFGFDISSIRGFSCSDIELIAVSSLTKNIIDIYIDGFVSGEGCSDGDYYPKKEMVIGELSEGDYALNIYIQGEIQNTLNLVFDGKIFLIRENEELIALDFPYKELNRTPEKTIWGRLSSNIEENNFLEQELLANLENYGLLEQNLVDGRYSSFIIENEEIVSGDFSSTYTYGDNFTLSYSEINEGELEAVLNEFLVSFEEQYELELELYSSEGWEF